ncbi:hypothetical protein DEU56DRAFT_802752 [Suillus clintonianus]|uniref:uncharacterized protein n=1 Tax=Suillus clintonianus TaxID=1904413 RepID=UPI001B86CF2A|nr:uncharacterized protein DEU56DRAFT_802752 [Suillus clintonianus]KAG2138336.1 hypothetical protein DEU56DRAFT_802752 [Suillus clintonianus]
MSSTDNTKWYRLSHATRQAVVQRYTISGYPVNEADPNSVLHWRIFAKCVLPDDNSRIVTLDMMPGQDSRTGVLAVTEAPDESSQAGVADVTERAATEITVESLLDLLESKGRNRFIYDDTGSGCRFWCHTVLGDLERIKLVSDGAISRFDTYVAEQSQENTARFPLPTREGTFY